MKRPEPVGVPYTCPVLDRLAALVPGLPQPDQIPAQICVELLRLYHHELRSAAEQRVPKDRAAIQARIEGLFAQLEAGDHAESATPGCM